MRMLDIYSPVRSGPMPGSATHGTLPTFSVERYGQAPFLCLRYPNSIRLIKSLNALLLIPMRRAASLWLPCASVIARAT